MKPFVDRRGVGLSFFSAETYYISVEATAKGLIAYSSLESLNDPVRHTRSIEPSKLREEYGEKSLY